MITRHDQNKYCFSKSLLVQIKYVRHTRTVRELKKWNNNKKEVCDFIAEEM